MSYEAGINNYCKKLEAQISELRAEAELPCATCINRLAKIVELTEQDVVHWKTRKTLVLENDKYRKALKQAVYAMEACRCGGYDVSLHKEYTTADGALAIAREVLKPRRKK